jgi:hypothetical protein
MTFLSNSEQKEHPLLVIPNDEGCLVVVGTVEAQILMTKKQMFEKGMEFLRRSAQRDAEET